MAVVGGVDGTLCQRTVDWTDLMNELAQELSFGRRGQCCPSPQYCLCLDVPLIAIPSQEHS